MRSRENHTRKFVLAYLALIAIVLVAGFGSYKVMSLPKPPSKVVRKNELGDPAFRKSVLETVVKLASESGLLVLNSEILSVKEEKNERVIKVALTADKGYLELEVTMSQTQWSVKNVKVVKQSANPPKEG